MEIIYGKLMAEAEIVKINIDDKRKKVDMYIKKFIKSQFIFDMLYIRYSLDLPSISFVSFYFTKCNICKTIYSDGRSNKESDIPDELQTYLNPENIKSLFDKLFRIKKLCFSTNYLDNLPKAYTFILCSPFCQDITKLITKKILFFPIIKN